MLRREEVEELKNPGDRPRSRVQILRKGVRDKQRRRDSAQDRRSFRKRFINSLDIIFITAFPVILPRQEGSRHGEGTTREA